MKNKGLTIIESVVAIALLGIIFLLVVPLISSFGKVKNRVKTQKEIDAEFSVVNEFIQKKIKSAKVTGESVGSVDNESGSYVGVYPSFDSTSFDFTGKLTNEEGNVLFLEVPDIDGDPEFIFFILGDGELKYRDGINGTEETLMTNIDSSLPDDDEDTKRAKSNFKLHEGIVVYHIKLDLTSYTYGDENYEGKIRGALRGSASTRIDINFE